MTATPSNQNAQSTRGRAILPRVFRRNRVLFPLGVAFLCLFHIAETLVPIAIGLLIDRVIRSADTDAMLEYGALLIGLFVTIVVAWRFGSKIIRKVVENEAHRLRLELVARVLDPRGMRRRVRIGELLNITTHSADRTANVLGVLARTAGAFTAAAVAIVALLVIDLALGIVVIVATPIILGALNRATPTLTKHASAQQSAGGWASALATDLVSGLRPLRGIGGEEMAAHRYRTQSRIALRAATRSARINGVYTGASHTANGILAVIVAGYGGYLALAGTISVGELIAVVGLSQYLPGPLGTLAATPRNVAVARAAARRVSAVLGADYVLDTRTHDLPPGRRDLHINNLSYKRLNGLSLTASPGELIGIVAYNPHDAETLVEVIAGQVPPTEYTGQVKIGDVDLHNIDAEQARSALIVEPHRTDLFTGTIGTNVTAGRPDARPDHITRALAASAADDVVNLHDDGLDHPVTDRGESLSGGQRQRIALARALVAAPSALVLHDPTTAVDAVTENIIAEGLTHFRHLGTPRAHTTVVITSSPALLSHCDRVVVLKDGQIDTTDTHENLVQNSEQYRRAVLR
ncbi:ABC transporter ATP-binding protein [Hoyosella rhizosphaerae]|uniref:ABC transporter permease n=1 Tax=Hoyosella rhizosphaerae TaxID=1755582 RepID=A0A916UKL0_9ACTN|nr:ABC transporter ATP-binding protein [Hoyosella rhizosphaerae]MBN4928363.1 ABC transporter ATP-binding protein [Hoyosella rhizosphaerae]GGC74368.1 ABC transporter permease [Hoyosella rhizosphaerae]